MNQDKQALLAALNTLISSSDAQHLFSSLTTVAQLKTVHPVMMSGDAEVLNPLLVIARGDRERFDRYMVMVDAKRAEAGLAPLAPPKDDKFDKSAYMREFMYQKRQRQRRAAEIENMTRGKDRLIGRTRLDFMDVQAAKWKVELDRRIAAVRAAQGQHLPKETLDAVRAQFWAWVDETLDEAEAQAKLRILTG
jgi:hypothetical protein